MPARKAASVLPEPVGARISVCAPEAMAGHPWACAAVGSGNDVENQARTGSEKPASALPSGASPGRELTPPGYGRGVTPTRPRGLAVPAAILEMGGVEVALRSRRYETVRVPAAVLEMGGVEVADFSSTRR